MEAVEAYKIFIALKNHFTRENYDYFKYNGKTTASKSSFETRKDKYMYHKLSKKQEPVEFVVANFVKHGPTLWVGDMVTDAQYEQNYTEWKKRQESLTYVFTQDIQKLLPSFDGSIKVVEGQHPKLLKLYLQDKVSVETLIIIDRACSIFGYWNKKMAGDVMWTDIYLKCIKYKPFVSFDTNKMKSIILKTFEVSEDEDV